MTFFSCKFGLWEVLWNLFSVQPLSWSSPVVQLLYKIHFSSCHSLIGKWFVIVAYDKRRRHYKTIFFFFFFVSSQGTYLSSFFTFPICFKCQMIVEWPTLGSSATFCVVVRGSALMMLSIGGFQLPVAGHCVLIFKALISFAKLLEPSLYCTFITSSWAKCVDVASCLCCFATHFEFE